MKSKGLAQAAEMSVLPEKQTGTFSKWKPPRPAPSGRKKKNKKPWLPWEGLWGRGGWRKRTKDPGGSRTGLSCLWAGSARRNPTPVTSSIKVTGKALGLAAGRTDSLSGTVSLISSTTCLSQNAFSVLSTVCIGGITGATSTGPPLRVGLVLSGALFTVWF